jgi:undecaprenyl-diphosphatase
MDLFELLKALLFGVVEGISEWLPISSTGHMMLLNSLLPLDVSASFYDTFLVVIQLGAIMAVIILFFHKLNPFSPRKNAEQKRTTWGIWAKVVVGSIPAAVVGLALDDWMEETIMNNDSISYLVVSASLIVYGVIFIILEIRNRHLIQDASAPRGRHAINPAANERVAPVGRQINIGGYDDNEASDPSNAIASVRNFDELSYGKAFCIGIFQSLAIIPGTSRSGSTIIGSLLLGTSRTVATEFAFFLAIPIMFGWSLLKFIKHGFDYTQTEWMIFAVGIVTAFFVSIVSIKFLIGYIKKNDFTAFGIYRIVVGILMIVFFGQFVNHIFF